VGVVKMGGAIGYSREHPVIYQQQRIFMSQAANSAKYLRLSTNQIARDITIMTHICTYVHTHTHTHTYIYIYFFFFTETYEMIYFYFFMYLHKYERAKKITEIAFDFDMDNFFTGFKSLAYFFGTMYVYCSALLFRYLVRAF
jgi:hypothetical protein